MVGGSFVAWGNIRRVDWVVEAECVRCCCVVISLGMNGESTSRSVAHRRADGRYANPWAGGEPHGFGDFLRWVVVERRKNPRRPDPLPSAFPAATPSFPARAARSEIVITWVGHSSFLLQIAGANVLLDPMWGERASPVSFAGPRRHVPPGVAFADLPKIDLVVISHDHYDHLDLETVRAIVRAHPDAAWIAPLGVGKWLRKRGARVEAELDWWQSASVASLEVTCTPAQHFSGRKPNNRNETLWCGWTIAGAGRSVYYAGDTARHPEFGGIARTLGPFDAAFLPIGAYEPRWFMGAVHMAPEEAVDAFRDVARENGERRCTMVAMHWGTFKLTDEPLDEPPRLTREAWSAAGPPGELWIPRHGETKRL